MMSTLDLRDTIGLLNLARRLRARRRLRAPVPAERTSLRQDEAALRIAQAFRRVVPGAERAISELAPGAGLLVEFYDPDTETSLGAVELRAAGGFGKEAIADIRMPEGAPPDEVILAALDGVTVQPASPPPPQGPPLPAPASALPSTQWVTGASVDRSGAATYTHLIRSPDDPKRCDIQALPEAMRDRSARWRRDLKSTPVDAWRWAIWQLLQDGQPRTFNRIGVELLDKTADLLLDLPPDRALWSLVADEKVEHTLTAPILFRVRAGATAPLEPVREAPIAAFTGTLLSARPRSNPNDPTEIARYVRARAKQEKNDKTAAGRGEQLAQQVERAKANAVTAAGWLEFAARKHRQVLWAHIASDLRLGVHTLGIIA